MRSALLVLVLVLGCAEPKLEPKALNWLRYVDGGWVEKAIVACPAGFSKVCDDVCARWCARERMLVVVGKAWSDDECFMQLSGASAGLGGAFLMVSSALEADARCAHSWAVTEEERSRERWYRSTGVWQ